MTTTSLWSFLYNGDRKATGGIPGAKAIYVLANLLAEEQPSMQQVNACIANIASLLDLLNLPFHQLLEQRLALCPLALDLYDRHLQQSGRPPQLACAVALIGQAAFIESTLATLALPQHQALCDRVADIAANAAVARCTQQVATIEIPLTEAQAVLSCFAASRLGKLFGQVLLVRLQQLGMDRLAAVDLQTQILHATHRTLYAVVPQLGYFIDDLSTIFPYGTRVLVERYGALDAHREEELEALAGQKLFAENFGLADLYVPVRVKKLDREGRDIRKDEAFDLHSWLRISLYDAESGARAIVLQSKTGMGKTTFCTLFANWVRQYLYPSWIPIIIPLRSIATLHRSLEQTLSEILKERLPDWHETWLSDRNTRFLFFLDGFEDLPLTGKLREQFLKQVAEFQLAGSKTTGHRIVLTLKVSSLQLVQRSLPEPVERLEILPFSPAQQQQWFELWQVQVGAERAIAFQQFLAQQNCAVAIAQLAAEPLSLYLLGLIHAHQKLSADLFEQLDLAGARIVLYRRAIDCLLVQKHRPSIHQSLTELELAGLRRILMEAGLCATQVGREEVILAVLMQRLEKEESTANLLKHARQHRKNNLLRKTLAAFYSLPGLNDGDRVEFAHKSLGEFLYADRLRKSLEAWSETPLLQEQLEWEIYDLLGSGGLKPEAIETLMALLAASRKLQPALLFQHLQGFYERWCDGAIPLPFLGMSQHHLEHLSDLRRVDVCTGLNVLLLLVELHCYAHTRESLRGKICFYPCGQRQSENFDRDRLMRVIGYSRSLGVGTFHQLVGYNLRNVHLAGANLGGTNFSNANLSGIILSRAHLSGADLSGADLSNANLQGANLSGANLTGANLVGANLRGSNLRGANFTGANLIGAYLSGANLRGANLSRANLIDAYLSGTYLSGAYLTGAYLRGTYLNSADLRRANFFRAYLCHADLSNADLSHANLSEANLSAADLTQTNLTSACLENILWDADTQWDGALHLEAASKVPESLLHKAALRATISG